MVGMRNCQNRKTATPNAAVSYCRASTAGQVDHGVSIPAQRAQLQAEAQRRGWTIVADFADEAISGSKAVSARPGLTAAVEAIEAGQASILLVHKSDRAARSLRTLLDLIDRVERAGGAIVAADGTIDTSTAPGRFTTQIMGGVAELERALISERTKAALAHKRSQGIRLGRPSVLDPDVLARIVAERAAGAGFSAIARGLNDDAVPTARGGTKWFPATVARVLEGQDAAALRAA